MNYAGSTYYYTPMTNYANLTGLNALPTNSSVSAVASSLVNNGQATTRITLSNSNPTNLAFFVRAEVTRGPGGEEVVPVTYTDNYINLWPGESATIVAQYAAADLGGQPAFVRVRGYNVPQVQTPLMGFQAVGYQPGGGCLVQCSGSPGASYTLQTAPDPGNWTNLATLPADTNGLFQFLDTSATNYAKRFYRLKYP